MEAIIWGSGREMKERDMVGYGGLMGRNIRDIGRLISRMGKVFLLILMGIFIEESGWMGCLMGRES